MSDEAYQHWRQYGGVFDLSARTKLLLTGADCVRFLNGQVTANVKKLDAETALPACVTTAKGKLSAEVFISSATSPADGSIFVDADEALRDSLPARLERYIVADDVTVEDVTESHSLLHLVGPLDRARGFAASVLCSGEEETQQSPPWTLGAMPNVTLRAANRYGTPGWDVWLSGGTTGPVIDALRSRGQAGEAWGSRQPGHAIYRFLELHGQPRVFPPDLAETIRIEAGVPRWGHELTEDTLPPEAGLDRTHVDYAKGCYIGQEVISRIKSVGHVNRRLRGFISAGGEPLQAGWSVFAPGDPQKAVGELTSAAWSFALAKPVALGYLRRGSPSGALLARPADGATPPVEVIAAELPLAVHFSQS